MNNEGMSATVAAQLSEISDNLTLIYLSGLAVGKAAPIVLELTDGTQISFSSVSNITTEYGEISKILRDGEEVWQRGDDL